MCNRDKISLTILAMIISGVVAYFTGQASIAQSIADRPTRQEMKETVKATQEETQRQLDDIKRQQEKAYNETKAVNDKVDKVLYELRFNNRGR